MGHCEDDEEKRLWRLLRRREDFFRSLHMPVCIGELEIGVQSDEVLRKLADSATKGDAILLGSFKKINAEDAYQIYRAANHD